MNRLVLPELLDVLSPEDPAARRSRRDLRRLNSWMRHPHMMSRALRAHWRCTRESEIVELGAGDGNFLLSVARRLNGRCPDTRAVLVDRLPAVAPETFDAFRRAGWQARSEIAEATAWLKDSRGNPGGVVVSNLFFHQFEDAALVEMLTLAAAGSRLVVALEPRRSWLARLAGRLLWVIGCGPVTRHDAVVSVRAGFAHRELSALWPDSQGWRLTERPAGLFSHLFIAQRKD